MMLFAGLIAAGGPWWGDARAEALAARSAKPVDPLAFLDADPAAGSPRRADLLAAKRATKRQLRWSPRYTSWIATVLIIAVIASAAFPYLSLRFSRMAAGETDLAAADARAHTAAWLDPTAVHPFAARATAYTLAAQQLPENSSARANDLRAAADAWVDAARRVPVVWLNSYMAASALVDARDAALAAGMTSDADYLGQSARTYLEKARQLNPLSRQVEALEKRL
jgi:hypothetical protein